MSKSTESGLDKQIITDDKTMIYGGEPQIFSRVKCDCSREISQAVQEALAKQKAQIRKEIEGIPTQYMAEISFTTGTGQTDIGRETRLFPETAEKFKESVLSLPSLQGGKE